MICIPWVIFIALMLEKADQMCHIPHSLRTQTWKIVNRTIRGSLVSASLLLWKQDATAKSTSTTVGFKSPESVFSASRPLYIPPLLPQSALLNSLPGPLDAELVGQIQAYVESFQQLLHPTPRQARQIAQNSSVLWYNLRINAQRAAGMLFYNQQQFNLPEGDEIDEKELNIDYLQHNKTIQMLKESLVELVIAAQRSQVDRCLGLMQTGLCHLHDVAVNLVTANSAGDSGKDYSLTASPARVKVVLRFRLLGDFRDREPAVEDYDLSLPDSVTADDTGPERSVTLLVDCLNYPVTSAAFLDLCRRGFYEGLPVAFLPVEVGGSNRTYSATALGYFAEGDVSAVTGLQQRTPLEVFREEAVSEREAEGKSRYRTRRRFSALGGARNSAVFTRARPVQDFSTYGAIGMFHAKDDLNGASTTLFWLPYNHSQQGKVPGNPSPADLHKLNTQYALFAYAVEGGQTLPLLRPGDMVVGCRVL